MRYRLTRRRSVRTFASAKGVKLLSADPAFQKFLKASEFHAVIGLDAITDTNAVAALKKAADKFPNFMPKLLLHKQACLFHPKTMWLRTLKGGVTITGSGNLTLGGLTDNWEALSVERLNVAEMDTVEARWESWLIACKKELLELDDPKALERAAANKVQRAKIKKALKFPGAEEEAEAEGIEEGVEEIIQELAQNQVLIAEVPKGSNRWNSVGFDLITYQQFFGVTLGKRKNVQFYHVQPDGSWEAAEQRQSVEVKSQNYRFEVGAAHGIPYPVKGHPLLIFQRITNSIFNYLLLMPGEKQHTLIQSYLDNNYANNKRIKRRIVITAGELQKVWPECPFFI